MNHYVTQSSVLLIVFNRLDTTKRVFESIRAAQPKKLYVAADGPRIEIPGEAQLCKDVREIVRDIDWDCELHTFFHEENLGCGVAPAKAISWFFDHVESGIILEDDCVPNDSFFHFCDVLLQRYKDDEGIMHISGNNFSFKRPIGKESYFFNYFFTAWGWATWRRAWKKYDFNITFLDKFLSSGGLAKIATSKKQYKYWQAIFEEVRNGKRKDIWDYQWILCCWYYNAFAISPSVNLVTNIGFDQNATHTFFESKVSYVKSCDLLEIKHPEIVKRNTKLDKLINENYFNTPTTLTNKARNIFYKYLPPNLMKSLRKVRRRYLPKMK